MQFIHKRNIFNFFLSQTVYLFFAVVVLFVFVSLFERKNANCEI